MMFAGVRPTIRFASAPIARTRFVRASIATTEGSLMTMPRSFTWTRVLAVPRSMPMSRENRPRMRSSIRKGSPQWVGIQANVGVQTGAARVERGKPEYSRAASGGRGRTVAGAVERHAPVPQRDIGVVADDEVVEDVDVEEAARGEGLGGEVEVVRRRRRVARR